MARKIGEEKLKDKYKFKEKSILEKIERVFKVYEIFEEIPEKLEEIENSILSEPEKILKLKEYFEKIKSVYQKVKKYFIKNKDGLDLAHTRGYALAEIMYKHFGAKESFLPPEMLFEWKNGRYVLKHELLENLSEEEKREIYDIYTKIDKIYETKLNLMFKFSLIDVDIQTIENLMELFSSEM